MEIFSALLAICAGNSPVTGEFPTQRPVTRSFDVFIDLRLNKRLGKQWGWWFETPSRPLWRHCNGCPNDRDAGLKNRRVPNHSKILKPKSYDANCVITGGTGGCQNNNLLGHQERQVWHHNTSSVSVMQHSASKISINLRYIEFKTERLHLQIKITKLRFSKTHGRVFMYQEKDPECLTFVPGIRWWRCNAVLMCTMMIGSCHNFAHVTTAKLCAKLWYTCI